MATYLELRTLAGGPDGSDLRKKIITAMTIKAEALMQLANPTNAQLTFAKNALGNPRTYEAIVLNAALAANKDATYEQIRDAGDSTVQNVVDQVVDDLLVVLQG